MNKVYNVVWNASLSAWCVTSEFAKSKKVLFKKALASSVLTLISCSVFADSLELGGGSVDSTATDSIAIGSSSKVDANAVDSVAIGNGAEVKQLRSIAIGIGAVSDGLNSTAIGAGAETNDNDSIALGTRAIADEFSTALGEESKALGKWSLSSGFESESLNTFDAAYGFKAVASGGSSLAMGFGATSSGDSSSAIGSSASATGSRDIAYGAQSSASGGFGAAIGYEANKTANRAFAIGDNSSATALQSFSIGNWAETSAENALAISTYAKADAADAISIGDSSDVTSTATSSGILGNQSTVSAANSFAIGNNNSIETADTFALGNNISSTLDNSVFLGDASSYVDADSTTGGNGSVASTTITNSENNATTFSNYAGSQSSGVVSVGNSSSQRRIQNVAAGLVSQGSTDAINGSQLYSVEDTVAEGYSFAAPSGDSFNLPLGSTFNLYGATTAASGVTFDSSSTPVSGSYSAKNVQTVTDGKGGIQVQLAEDPDFDAITANQVTVGPVIISNTGIDMGGEKITHLAAGTADDDAVNVSQLNSVKNIASAGWNIETDSGENAKSNVSPTSTVTITGDKDISVTNSGNNVSVALSNDVTIGSNNNAIEINGKDGTITDGTGDNRVAINGNTGTVQAGKITINGSTGTEDGLTNTTWDPNNYVSGQAATEDQLHALSEQNSSAVEAAKTEVDAGDNIQVTSSNDAKDGHTIYTVATSKDVNFNSVHSNSVNVGNVTINDQGINAGNQKITNVAAGEISSSSHDAINGAQLYKTNSSVANYFGGGSKVDANGNITAPTYNVAGGSYNNVGDALGAVDNKVDNLAYDTQQGFDQMNHHINKVERRLSSGIAGVAAMEPAPYVAGKFTYAMGSSYYNDQGALGITFRRTADDGRWSLTAGAAVGTEGQPIVRVGISGVIN
ncbi:hypothetical protein HGT73_11130 [Rosenbergiella australiborealis]|uniref:Head domain of trimeric autotransporter adhesin n=1 Tax=Rosenbergiella australiborealis TaxID=1544696 RepID=A0ABS5T719_9GAMM|nr:ESPR-type extended signal peptide-containing protein [Rosenbergiella australiborealis]MBT0727917.1 hypothetical protein [Rosenbergiella australiborealis]